MYAKVYTIWIQAEVLPHYDQKLRYEKNGHQLPKFKSYNNFTHSISSIGPFS